MAGREAAGQMKATLLPLTLTPSPSLGLCGSTRNCTLEPGTGLDQTFTVQLRVLLHSPEGRRYERVKEFCF